LIISLFGNRKTVADLLCQFVGDLGVAGNCLDMTTSRVAPKRVGAAFPFEVASIPSKMSQKGLALHPHRDHFPVDILRHSAQSILPAIFEKQQDGLT
jgi:hypothetical protein